MQRLILRKLGELIVVLLVVSIVSFMLLSLVPGGNPAVRILGDQATPESVEALNEELGLNDPIVTRYLNWLGDVLQGDLGYSTDLNQEVSDVLKEKLPVTIQLAVMAIGIGILFAVPIGVLAAWKAGSRLDKVVTSISFAVLSLPGFLIAIALLIIFAVNWKILPATPAWVPFTEDPLQNLKNLILPVASMAIGEIAVLSRVLRSDMIEVLQSDFVDAARAKGLSNRFILFRHALPASLTSMLTLIGLQIAGAMTGAVVIEQIFGLPGIGRTLLLAISRRDLVLVQGIVLVVASAYVIVNFAVDLAYRLTDPRLRDG